MTALREAAQAALASMDQMLQSGEWYCAQERADALRAAIQGAGMTPTTKADIKRLTKLLGSWADSEAHFQAAYGPAIDRTRRAQRAKDAEALARILAYLKQGEQE